MDEPAPVFRHVCACESAESANDEDSTYIHANTAKGETKRETREEEKVEQSGSGLDQTADHVQDSIEAELELVLCLHHARTLGSHIAEQPDKVDCVPALGAKKPSFDEHQHTRATCGETRQQGVRSTTSHRLISFD